MERKKALILGTVVTAFAALSAWAAFSIPDAPPPQEDTGKKREMTYGDNTIREEIGGKVVWELTTSSSAVDVNTQATSFKDAEGKYYFADGKVLTLTAPSGHYNSKTKNVKLEGGVKATISDGSELTSQTLEWVAKKDRLVAAGDAKISQPGVSISADRIEGWNQFQEFKATGNAHFVKENDKETGKEGTKAK